MAMIEKSIDLENSINPEIMIMRISNEKDTIIFLIYKSLFKFLTELIDFL